MADVELSENVSSQFNLSLVPECETPIRFKEKCPLCCKLQSSFCCEACIQNKVFSISLDPNAENFLDKELRYLALKEKKEKSASMCREILKERHPNCNLPQEIRDCTERIRTLRSLIQEKRETLSKTEATLEDKRQKNKARKSKMPRYKERVEKLAAYVKRNMRNEILDRREKLTKAKSDLKTVVRQNINNLVRYVFPIVKINPTSRSYDDEDSEIVSELAEATKTSFVRGTWVLMDSSGELQHQIVAPTLPGSGDYSAYLAAADAEGGVPVTEQIGSNEAYNIGAGLCYTTQLVNLIAFYLDVILPKKVSYADFCLIELTDKQFHRKVARLNANVLFLCFSQGMDSVLLNPKHTLNNLLQLVQHADLGKTGPFHVDAGLLLSLECEDADLRGDEGSEEEEGDQFPWEWEAIPLVPCPSDRVAGSAMSNVQMSSGKPGGDSGIGGSVTVVKDSCSAPEELDWDDDVTEINSQDMVRLAADVTVLESPRSESLLMPKNGNLHEFPLWENSFMKLSLDHQAAKSEISTQTELLLPFEATRSSLDALRKVEVLKGLFFTKRLVSERKNAKRPAVDELLRTASYKSRTPLKRKPEEFQWDRTKKISLKPSCPTPSQPDITIIDLEKETEQNTVNEPIPSCTIQEELRDISTEAVRYSLRQQLVDEPTRNALWTVYDYVGKEIKHNEVYVAENWTGSLIETASELLIQAADLEGSSCGAMVTRLCDRIITCLCEEKRTNSNKVQESRLQLVLKFCESSIVSLGVVNLTLLQLTLFRESLVSDASENFVHMLESAMYLVHIAYTALKRLEDLHESESIHTPSQKSTSQINVLNLWRSQWRPASRNVQPIHAPSNPSVLSIWSHELELVLGAVLEHAPLLAPCLSECVAIIQRLIVQEKKNIN